MGAAALPIAVAGSSIIGGIMQQQGVEDTNSANQAIAGGNNATAMAIAQMNNDREINLANTTYQRGMADLKAAGLNPILAATGNMGDPTPSMIQPSLTTPTMQNPNAGFAQLGSALASSAMDAQVKHAQIENIQADTTNKLTANAGIGAGSELAVRTLPFSVDRSSAEASTAMAGAKVATDTVPTNIDTAAAKLRSLQINNQIDQLSTASAAAQARQAGIDNAIYGTNSYRAARYTKLLTGSDTLGGSAAAIQSLMPPSHPITPQEFLGGD